MTKNDGQEISLNEMLLATVVNLLVRRFGVDGILHLPNFRESLVGSSKVFSLWAALAGEDHNDLLVGIDPVGNDLVTLAGLREEEAAVEKEQVH